MIGFDLDLTLIDSVPGVVATLDALGAELDVAFPSEEISAALGPPLDQLLAPYLPAGAIEHAADRFRALYPTYAVPPTPALPGAVESLAAVRAEHGRVVVVTGKYAPNAQLHVDHLGLDVDVVEGWVWGVAKGAVLRAHGASIYVGDHVHDVEGARAAGVVSVSVLTGGCTRAQLEAAGTDVVLDDLTEFPAWLAGHLLAVRLAALESELRRLGSVLVAFSGGADSAFLLAAAVRTLGVSRVVAATAYSDALPASERGPAREFAESLGVRLLTPSTAELERAGYVANAGDRCAFCKAELLDVLGPLAAETDVAVVVTGTNADDARAGFRPGITAAAERGAATPLLTAGLTKAQIRSVSRAWNLPTWDKPAAACLSSRIAFGIPITPVRLARVERAEASARAALEVAGLTCRDLRVRDLGELARLEVDRELLGAVPDAVLDAVRGVGFAAVEIDPLGFRSGSMNELLDEPELYR